ncbi:MAG TPA: hypothetical protein VK701_00035, partial [Solirubrobacteraceae bacterium]|nr:hypothetical protein [Solirubrobacteraceae bacterium]
MSSDTAALARIGAQVGRQTVPPRTDGHASAHGTSARRIGLRTVALGYLLLLLGAPVAMIFYRTFEHGLA